MINMPDDTTYETESDEDMGLPPATLRKLAAAASFLMAVAILASHWVYLTGNLDQPGGPLTYALADLLYGPVFGVGLVASVYALRERVGRRAPRLMDLALLLAVAAACAFMTVASIRSANRQYHLARPDLNIQSYASILITWATLVAGVIGVAFHFLGWAFVMIGAAGWMSGRLPRALCGLYAAAGVVSLLVYAYAPAEGTALVLLLAVSIWQGILLWRGWPDDAPSPHIGAGATDWA